jgi:hypothetical protein
MKPIRFGIFQLNDAKSLQQDLAKKNIEIFLNHNDKTCTRGCSITVEVLGYEKDLPEIAKVFQDNYKKLVEGLEVDWEVANSVFDPAKSTATCPACAAQFSTKETECPDCGLFIG